MILELIVWLVAMSPLVLLGGFLMWFVARRVTGKPCNYIRCCIATLISWLIQLVIGVFLGLALIPLGLYDNEPAVLSMACIEILAGCYIHVCVICRWLSVSVREALLIMVYHALTLIVCALAIYAMFHLLGTIMLALD